MAIFSRFIKFNKQICALIDRHIISSYIDLDYKASLSTKINNYLDTLEYTTVLEVGGIDRPLLTKSSKIKYAGLDIDYKENCREIYDEFILQSIESSLNDKYDIIISITLLEHVKNNYLSINSIYNGLSNGCATMHYVPSKYHPYSLILNLVGPRLQKTIINHFRPEAKYVAGYPAYFHLCSPMQMKRAFEEKGFRNVKIQPFYRAADYFNFFVPLYAMVVMWENICKRLGLVQFCSGFIITAVK